MVVGAPPTLLPTVRLTERGRKVLDVAAGWGGHAIAFAEAGADVIASDLNDHAFDQLKGFAGAHKLALSPNPVAPTWFRRFPATTAMATIASFRYTTVPALLLPDPAGSRSPQTTPGSQ